MDMGLQNKSALITGSTKGIGKAIARVMAGEGVNVIINGRKAADVDAIVAEIKADYPNTNPKEHHLTLPIRHNRRHYLRPSRPSTF